MEDKFRKLHEQMFEELPFVKGMTFSSIRLSDLEWIIDRCRKDGHKVMDIRIRPDEFDRDKVSIEITNLGTDNG